MGTQSLQSIWMICPSGAFSLGPSWGHLNHQCVGGLLPFAPCLFVGCGEGLWDVSCYSALSHTWAYVMWTVFKMNNMVWKRHQLILGLGALFMMIDLPQWCSSTEDPEWMSSSEQKVKVRHYGYFQSEEYIWLSSIFLQIGVVLNKYFLLSIAGMAGYL